MTWKTVTSTRKIHNEQNLSTHAVPLAGLAPLRSPINGWSCLTRPKMPFRLCRLLGCAIVVVSGMVSCGLVCAAYRHERAHDVA